MTENDARPNMTDPVGEALRGACAGGRQGGRGRAKHPAFARVGHETGGE